MYQRAAVVPIWIGDEEIHTEDAFQVRSACGRIRYITADGGLFRKRTSELHRHPNFLGPYHSSLAGGCTSQVFWAGVIDPMSTRTYFSQLWMIQENVQSSKALAVWENHQIERKQFQKPQSKGSWQCQNRPLVEILPRMMASNLFHRKGLRNLSCHRYHQVDSTRLADK
jgi:hypothetical protein